MRVAHSVARALNATPRRRRTEPSPRAPFCCAAPVAVRAYDLATSDLRAQSLDEYSSLHQRRDVCLLRDHVVELEDKQIGYVAIGAGATGEELEDVGLSFRDAAGFQCVVPCPVMRLALLVIRAKARPAPCLEPIPQAVEVGGRKQPTATRALARNAR
jgi:hypothetical protein